MKEDIFQVFKEKKMPNRQTSASNGLQLMSAITGENYGIERKVDSGCNHGHKVTSRRFVSTPLAAQTSCQRIDRRPLRPVDRNNKD